MGPGPLIAIYVVLLYAFLAPLVLFGIYVLFDTLGRPDAVQKKNTPGRNNEKKDPAVWTAQDIAAFVDQA